MKRLSYATVTCRDNKNIGRPVPLAETAVAMFHDKQLTAFLVTTGA
jgi:hypothetical protein